jgi:hypothetical protein
MRRYSIDEVVQFAPSDHVMRALKSLSSITAHAYPPNIFEVATGYYENPTRDLLMQFLRPEVGLEMAEVVLKALLPERGGTYGLLESVQKEVRTEGNSRIDLLLTGADYIAAVEVKIRHIPVNPFHEYEEYVERRAPEGISKIFILLSAEMTPSDVPPRWIHVTWKAFLDRWEAQLGAPDIEDHSNEPELVEKAWRGYVLAKEFINHVRKVFDMNRVIPDLHELQRQVPDYDLAIKARRAVTAYEAAIAEAVEKAVKQHPSFRGRNLELSVSRWGNGMIAFAFRLEGWPSKVLRETHEKVCLVLIPEQEGDQRFFVRAYLDTDDTFKERSELGKLDAGLTQMGFVRHSEDKHSFYYDKERAGTEGYETLPDAVQLLIRVLEMYDGAFKTAR